MKRIYVSPEIIETKMELVQMIATSLNGEGQNNFPTSYGEDNEEADSRYFDWDD